MTNINGTYFFDVEMYFIDLHDSKRQTACHLICDKNQSSNYFINAKNLCILFVEYLMTIFMCYLKNICNVVWCNLGNRLTYKDKYNGGGDELANIFHRVYISSRPKGNKRG